ncbi:hypothetical protein PV11_10234 [Exophiala sideris]|uniref:Uncharacterized protein n=1 Tax=Exophiala sideris TaxID=1016849 RepID=A0A0D1VR86_9EURO|nr:hypothetical protein PV11_10234 [Exophiala sideris]
METDSQAAQNDDFESFLGKYVTTNVAPGSVLYDSEFLIGELLDNLTKTDKGSFEKVGFYVLNAMCCAMKRADLVPSLFRSILRDRNASETDTRAIFSTLQETINIIWPFVGVPQVIPACLGLAGYLKACNASSIGQARSRQDFGPDDTNLGTETRKTIYKASANGEVFEMLATYFGDFSHALNGICFGYNIGRVDHNIFSLAESELVLTATLISLGATRQAESHIKACIAFGYTEANVKAVIVTAEQLSDWLGVQLPSTKSPIDVSRLAQQARKCLCST